jgi:hypothetical protein
LDNEIYVIKNPPKPKLLIDLENSVKAQESPDYANWIKIFNLQQAAHTLLYIQENDFADIDSLQSALRQSKTNYTDIQKQICVISDNVKSLKTLKEQVEIYRNTKDIYNKHVAPGQFSYFKNDYYNRHKEEIENHKKAKAYIYDELKLEKFPSLKKLSKEISELTEKEKTLRKDLKAAQKKTSALSTAEHNISMLLGYKKLESSGYIPTTPTDGLRFIKPYNSSFEEANKTGKTEEYFQSCHMDYDCVYDIYRAIASGQIHQKTAEEILVKYSKERAEGVVAAIVNNAPADMYSEHKKWASQKGGNSSREPMQRKHEIFQRHNDDTSKTLNSFIVKFREIADSMQAAVFRVDERGNPISKMGHALPREMEKPKSSMMDRWAAAEQKVKQQSYNQPAHSPHKRSKSSEMEL